MLILLESLSKRLLQKTEVANGVQTAPVSQPRRQLEIPAAYQISAAEIEAHLIAVFGSEKLAELEQIDLSNLPFLSQTSTEILSEDREDRF